MNNQEATFYSLQLRLVEGLRGIPGATRLS